MTKNSSKSSKILSSLLKLSVSLGIIVYIFMNKVDLKQCIEYGKAANPWLILLGFGVYVFLNFLVAMRWYLLLQVQGILLKLSRVVRLTAVGLFFNTFMIGLTGGDLVKIYYAAKQSHKSLEAGMTVFLDRIFGLMALTIMALVAMLTFGRDPRLAEFYPIVVLSASLLLLAAVLGTSKRFWGALPFLSKTLEKLPFAQSFKRIYQGVYIYKKHPSVLLRIFMLSLCAHLGLSTINYIVGHSLGIDHISLGQYMVIGPLIGFISALPISVSGWGVGEAMYVSMLGLFGVPAAQAVTMSLIVKMMYIALGLSSSIAYVFPGLEHPKSFETEGDDDAQ